MSRNFELLQNVHRVPRRRPHTASQHNGFQYGQPHHRVQRYGEPQFLLPALHVLKKHWRWSLCFAVLAVAAIAIGLFIMDPVYEPVARIQLETGQPLLSSSNDDARLSTVQYAETQAKNLQSRELHLEVIRKLGLHRNPHWLGTTRPRAGAVVVPLTAGALTESEYRALDLFERSLKVKHDNSSWLIDVAFAARDPKLAALVTNTLIEDFIERDYSPGVHRGNAHGLRNGYVGSRDSRLKL
jgi:uncharacterized protein involved in exopolysaccharide biosynthesis